MEILGSYINADLMLIINQKMVDVTIKSGDLCKLLDTKYLNMINTLKKSVSDVTIELNKKLINHILETEDKIFDAQKKITDINIKEKKKDTPNIDDNYVLIFIKKYINTIIVDLINNTYPEYLNAPVNKYIDVEYTKLYENFYNDLTMTVESMMEFINSKNTHGLLTLYNKRKDRLDKLVQKINESIKT